MPAVPGNPSRLSGVSCLHGRPGIVVNGARAIGLPVETGKFKLAATLAGSSEEGDQCSAAPETVAIRRHAPAWWRRSGNFPPKPTLAGAALHQDARSEASTAPRCVNSWRPSGAQKAPPTKPCGLESARFSPSFATWQGAADGEKPAGPRSSPHDCAASAANLPCQIPAAIPSSSAPQRPETFTKPSAYTHFRCQPVPRARHTMLLSYRHTPIAHHASEGWQPQGCPTNEGKPQPGPG